MSTDMARAMRDGTGGPRGLSMHARVALFAVALAAVTLSACQQDAASDPFVGPSELGLSLTLTASPDVLALDGASQSLVTILARDGSGRVLANVTLRLQIRYAGTLQDFGQLSARTLVTGSDGKALATYTAPLGGSVDTGSSVEILVTPVGDNSASALPRSLSIRLVPAGTIIPPAAFTADFQLSTTSPAEFENVLFEATDTSGQVVTYAWDFGDGTTGTGRTVTHAYSSASTYTVTLTVTDAYGRFTSAVQAVTVGAGATPTANFTFSPTGPRIGDSVFFNASASTAPAGRSIASYDWTFGDGTTGSGVTVSHVFNVQLSFNVTLTVTDDRVHDPDRGRDLQRSGGRHQLLPGGADDDDGGAVQRQRVDDIVRTHDHQLRLELRRRRHRDRRDHEPHLCGRRHLRRRADRDRQHRRKPPPRRRRSR